VSALEAEITNLKRDHQAEKVRDRVAKPCLTTCGTQDAWNSAALVHTTAIEAAKQQYLHAQTLAIECRTEVRGGPEGGRGKGGGVCRRVRNGV
jgi:hypothetical protein